MSITLTDLLEKLKQVEETSLLEILNITSEDLVERFSDIIEENYDTLVEEIEASESD